MQETGEYRGYTHFICHNCGFEHFNSDKQVLPSDYEGDTDYTDDLEVYPKANDRIQWHHEKARSFILKSLGSERATLDVGCFDGFFVRKLRDNGLDAYGIDFNRKAIAEGIERFGLEGRLSNKSTSDLLAEGRDFDVVTMFEVIEHLEDFDKVVSECVALLKPGGHLILSTPNAEMTWRPPLDYPPHHLSRFRPKSLQFLADSHDLMSLAIIEQSSCYDLVRHYVGLKFRNSGSESMRGGEFKNRSVVDPLRRAATRSKWLAYAMLQPVDWALHKIGFRYMGQLLVAQKR